MAPNPELSSLRRIQYPYPTADYSTFSMTGPFVEVKTYHGQQESNNAVVVSGGTTDTLGHAEHRGTYSARGGEDGVQLSSSHSARVQRSEKYRKSEKAANLREAVPPPKRRRGRKSCSTTQVSSLSRTKAGEKPDFT